jgi:hypothetical protein
MTSDGHKAYLSAVERHSGNDIDYAMLVKHYGAAPGASAQRRYSPAECVGTTVGTVTGQPDKKHISTSYAERANLSMRIVYPCGISPLKLDAAFSDLGETRESFFDRVVVASGALQRELALG